MKLTTTSFLLLSLTLTLAAASPAHALYGGTLPNSACRAAKAKCISKMKSCLLGCYNKSVGKGLPVDPECLDKCRSKFLGDPPIGKGCVEKAETSGDCGVSLNDGSLLRVKTAAQAADLFRQMVPEGLVNPVNKCEAGKIKCVAKYDACVLGIVSKAYKAGTPLGDLSKCNAILTNGAKLGCIQKIEDKSVPPFATRCLTYYHQSDLKNADDAFVNDVIYDLGMGEQNLNSKRCTGDTRVQCSSNANCPGLGTCEVYFGAPVSMDDGGFQLCLVNQWNGGISGTLNVELGQSAGSASLIQRLYGIAACPKCAGDGFPNDGVAGGTCTAGAHAGASCDVNGESPVAGFGLTSLDCGPSSGSLIATSTFNVPNTNTGTASKTVTAASPLCNGAPGKTCLCGGCSGNPLVPCANDADCTAASAGTCTSNVGALRQPNSCIDDTLTGFNCAATDECTAGPIDQKCASNTLIYCSNDLDCPSGDRCLTFPRKCFFGYEGNIGDKVTAIASHDTPHDHTGTATVASVFCAAATGAGTIDFSEGLPGPSRFQLAGVTFENGTSGACPTVAEFLPTSKAGGLDLGWSGLAHDVPWIGQGKVTVSVSCPGSPGSCGTCTYSGPIANP